MGSGNSKAKQAQGQDCQKEQHQAPGPKAPSPSQSKGVSLAFLSWLLEYVEDPDTTTRKVVEGIVKTQSEESRCAYVELLQQEQAHFVGPPDLYIIHAWDRPFHKLAKALVKTLPIYFPDKPPSKLFVWIDAFCVNQWSEQAPSEALQGAKAAMASCKGVVVCMDGQAGVLTRSWVLYEMYIAAKLPVTRLIVSAFIKGADLKHRLSSLNLAKASFTTCAEDKAAIIAAVEKEGGGAGGEQPLPQLLCDTLLESAQKSVVTLEKLKSQASDDVQAATEIAEAAVAASQQCCGGKDVEALAAAVQAAEHALTEANTPSGTIAMEYALAVSRAASILHALGNTADAHKRYDLALEVNDGHMGMQYAMLECSVLVAMSKSYCAAQQWGDAEMCCRSALDMHVDQFGENHIRTARSRVTRAVVLRRAGRHQEAEEEYRRALPVFEQSEGPSSPPTLVVVMGLAQVLMCAKKFKDAEALCKRAVKGLESSLGPSNSKVLAAMGLMGQAVRRQGRGEEAAAIKADIDKRSAGVAACARDDKKAMPEQATPPTPPTPAPAPAAPDSDGLHETPEASQADEAAVKTPADPAEENEETTLDEETEETEVDEEAEETEADEETEETEADEETEETEADEETEETGADNACGGTGTGEAPVETPADVPSGVTASEEKPEMTASDREPDKTVPDTVSEETTSDGETEDTTSDAGTEETASDKASDKTASDKASDKTASDKASDKTASDKAPWWTTEGEAPPSQPPPPPPPPSPPAPGADEPEEVPTPAEPKKPCTLPKIKGAGLLPAIMGVGQLPGILGAALSPAVAGAALLPKIIGANQQQEANDANQLQRSSGSSSLPSINSASRLSGVGGAQSSKAPSEAVEQPHGPKAPSSVASTQPEAHPWSQADEARSSHARGKEKAHEANSVYGALDRSSLSEESESTRPSSSRPSWTAPVSRQSSKVSGRLW